MNRPELIRALLDYGEQQQFFGPLDRVYVYNRVLAALKLDRADEEPSADFTLTESLPEPARYLEPLMDDAVRRGVIEKYVADRDRMDTDVMDAMMPRPSEVITRFYEHFEEDPVSATEWYYNFAKNSNYIRKDRIRRDMRWKYRSEYGDLDITINLSKPEKDPRAIAEAGKKKQDTSYPQCALCKEAEGYEGRTDFPARANHRIIPIELTGEDYYLQYSPYVYYNEHCIVLNKEHKPMAIDRAAFEHLIDFVSKMPHYFLGSNADLPIVGGSILSHDHFQGGHYRFAMDDAKAIREITLGTYPLVTVKILKWPMPVIRLVAHNVPAGSLPKSLLDLAERILNLWREYDDESVGVLHKTDGEPHNTITPIARRREDDIELDLVLRNNRTSEEHPLGIFHPHENLHHIKKENIGLIEVMGLAVLPSRLISEFAACVDALAEGRDLRKSPTTERHADWIDDLDRHGAFRYADSKRRMLDVLYDETGAVFTKVLEDAGVFKQDEEGQAAFKRFVDLCLDGYERTTRKKRPGLV